jgi:hypothetical protein
MFTRSTAPPIAHGRRPATRTQRGVASDGLVPFSRRLMALWVIASTTGVSGGSSVVAQTAPPSRDALERSIQAKSGDLQRFIDLLQSPSQATRLAALSELGRHSDPSFVELAITHGLASEDPAQRGVALRAAFRPVRSIVARVIAPSTPSAEASEVLKICGSGVQYIVEGYKYDTGAFEVRGQDHAGVGHVSGSAISLTIEYGCSLTGVLQPDGSFQGMVSAPYRKGALPAVFALR